MPESVSIKKLNESFLYLNASRSVSESVSEHFSFFADNYQWSPKFKSRMWDGKIRLFNSRFNTLPLGLKNQLIEFLKEADAEIEFEGFRESIDQEVLAKDFDRFLGGLRLPEGIEVRDYQRKVCLDVLQEDMRGLILSPTGSGKSLIIYLLIRYCLSRSLFSKVLLIVPTINLVTQMVKDFADYSSEDPSFDAEASCHQIFSGKEKSLDKTIVVSTWQSLSTMNKKVLTKFGGLICDEVHLAEAKEISAIVEASVNAEVKIGLTGTLKEAKINPLSLVGLFGRIFETRKTRELMDEGHLSDTPVVAMILNYPSEFISSFWEKVKALKAKKQNKKIYGEELSRLFLYENRNKVIVQLVKKFKNMNTLILFSSVKHAELVAKRLKEAGVDVFHMKSSMSAEERESIRNYAETHLNVAIVSTYQLFQLGINIRNLHNAIFGAPSKGRIRILQSFGRIIRPSPDGRVGYLIDLIDDLRLKSLVNIVYGHALKRLGFYQEEKLKIIYKKVRI